MEPAHASCKDFAPVEIAWLEPRRGLVGSVVEDHRSAYTVATVTIDRGNVRAADPIVLEAFIEWLDAHGSNSLGHQFANRIIHHSGHYPGPQAEAVRQIGRDIEFAAADMDLTF